jgi:hypothetical protein
VGKERKEYLDATLNGMQCEESERDRIALMKLIELMIDREIMRSFAYYGIILLFIDFQGVEREDTRSRAHEC